MSNVVQFEPRANDVVTEFVAKLRDIQQRDTDALYMVRALELALFGYTRCFGVAKTIEWLEGEAERLRINTDIGA